MFNHRLLNSNAPSLVRSSPGKVKASPAPVARLVDLRFGFPGTYCTTQFIRWVAVKYNPGDLTVRRNTHNHMSQYMGDLKYEKFNPGISRNLVPVHPDCHEILLCKSDYQHDQQSPMYSIEGHLALIPSWLNALCWKRCLEPSSKAPAA